MAWSRSGQGLTSFTDPADGATYVTLTCYPSSAPGVFCCFDQSDLTATMTLSVAVPDGWECIANGPVTQRPSEGRSGLWQFAPVPAMAPCEVALCAGPLVTDWHGDGGGGHVAMTVRRRRSLGGADGVAGLGTFGELSRRAIEQYERLLGVPCAFPKYDIVAVPDLAVLAESMPGLMLVNESLLARMIDPGDDKVAIVAAHEVAHLWFGCLVGARWWDDVWLDEAMATYLCYTIMSDPVDAGTPDMAGPWTAFCYRHELAAYRADELPGAEPVSAPVASATEALAKPPAITYHKGAGHQAARRADRRRRAARRARRLPHPLPCQRCRGARRPDRLPVAGLWPGSRRVGGRVAAHRGRLRTAAGADRGAGWHDRVAGRHPGQAADPADRDRALRPGRDQATPAPGGPRGGRRRTHARPVAGRREASRRGCAQRRGPQLHPRQVRRADAAHPGAAAMDVGDPLTEAVCWTAAWQLVIAAELAAADFADLVIRRLAGPALTGPPSAGPPIPGLPLVGVETLLERAVECADVYAPPADRAAIRERVAGTVLELTERNPGSVARGPTPQPRAPVPGRAACARDGGGNHTGTSGQREHPGNSAAGPRQQALAAGFAASAHSASQLDLLRSWLSGDLLPDGLSLTADLRARVLSPCPPADSPTTAISTRWPLPTPSPASSTVPPAAPCARIPPARKPPGGRRSPTIRTCGWRRRTRTACGWQVRRTSWPATVTGTSPKRCLRWRTGNPERRAASRGCCTRPRSSHRPRSRPPTRRFRLGIPAGSFGSSSGSSRQSCVQHSQHGQLPGGSSCRDHRPMPDEQVPRELING